MIKNMFFLICFMLFISACDSNTNYIKTENITPEIITNSSEEYRIITAEELLTHNSKDDCWIVFEKKVYDITDFISLHPGGEDALIDKCGKVDAFEDAFKKKHGTSKLKMFSNIAKFLGGTN